MKNFDIRLINAERSIKVCVGDRDYIEAMKRWLEGIDQGESFKALPLLDRRDATISLVTVFVLARSELDAEAHMRGEKFEPKADFCIEAKRRLESEGYIV